MADFGGLGGVMGGRDFDPEDLFEAAVKRALGHKIKNDTVAEEMWSALANVDWVHENGDTASYSWRAAGDLVAAVRDKNENYLDFYMIGPAGVVSDRIREALEKEGWKPVEE